MENKDLKTLRRDIDKIDQEIIMLINLRLKAVRKIWKIKKENSTVLIDQKREKIIEEKFLDQVKKSSPQKIKAFVRALLELSAKY